MPVREALVGMFARGLFRALGTQPLLRVIDPQQQRHVASFNWNFKEYDADLRRRKGGNADTPHRVTYKMLGECLSQRVEFRPC